MFNAQPITAQDLRDTADLLEQLEADNPTVFGEKTVTIDRVFLGECVSNGTLRFMIENMLRPMLASFEAGTAHPFDMSIALPKVHCHHRKYGWLAAPVYVEPESADIEF
jgi:hypothetical protein